MTSGAMWERQQWAAAAAAGRLAKQLQRTVRGRRRRSRLCSVGCTAALPCLVATCVGPPAAPRSCYLDGSLQTMIKVCHAFSINRLQKVQMYYRSGTGGRCCIGALKTLCAFTSRQHLCEWNDVMDAMLKLWRQIKNPTPSTDAYLLEEKSYQIPSRYYSKQAGRRLVRSLTNSIRHLCFHVYMHW